MPRNLVMKLMVCVAVFVVLAWLLLPSEDHLSVREIERRNSTRSITQEPSEEKVWPKVLTDENFEAEVLSSSQPVLVDFWASWCKPCAAMSPRMDELAKTNDGIAVVGKVNVDSCPRLARKYSISEIPTLMIFKDGKVVQTFTGVQTTRRLQSALDAVK